MSNPLPGYTPLLDSSNNFVTDENIPVSQLVSGNYKFVTSLQVVTAPGASVPTVSLAIPRIDYTSETMNSDASNVLIDENDTLQNPTVAQIDSAMTFNTFKEAAGLSARVVRIGNFYFFQVSGTDFSNGNSVYTPVYKVTGESVAPISGNYAMAVESCRIQQQLETLPLKFLT